MTLFACRVAASSNQSLQPTAFVAVAPSASAEFKRSVKKRIEEWKDLIGQKKSKDKMEYVNWIIGLL